MNRELPDVAQQQQHQTARRGGGERGTGGSNRGGGNRRDLGVGNNSRDGDQIQEGQVGQGARPRQQQQQQHLRGEDRGGEKSGFRNDKKMDLKITTNFNSRQVYVDQTADFASSQSPKFQQQAPSNYHQSQQQPYKQRHHQQQHFHQHTQPNSMFSYEQPESPKDKFDNYR